MTDDSDHLARRPPEIEPVDERGVSAGTRRSLRWALVGAIAGYLVGVVIAVPIAALVFGEATTGSAHRSDLWAFAFWGGALGAVAGAVIGFFRARVAPRPEELESGRGSSR